MLLYLLLTQGVSVAREAVWRNVSVLVKGSTRVYALGLLRTHVFQVSNLSHEPCNVESIKQNSISKSTSPKQSFYSDLAPSVAMSNQFVWHRVAVSDRGIERATRLCKICVKRLYHANS